MERAWADIFTYLSLYSVFIPVFVGGIRYKLLTSLQRLVFLLVLITLLGEFGVYQLSLLIYNNLPAVHLFTVVQFIVLVLILEKGLLPFFSKLFIRSIIGCFLVFALMDALIWNGVYNFNSYSRPMASFLLLFLAISFFYKTLKELKIKSLEREPLFWISIGILIYFSGNLFIFLFTNYVKASNEALLTIWGIHAIFNIILNISYAIALWIKPVN